MHYSIIPATQYSAAKGPGIKPKRLLTAPVSGVTSAKMMHDFGVSRLQTIIMDLPLSLDPLNLAMNKPVVSYDPTLPSRFGIFPRYQPDQPRWFETSACCIFHTANSWDSTIKDPRTGREVPAVNMLACRLTSASLVFSAGDLAAPVPTKSIPSVDQEEEQCRLYYYQFPLSQGANAIAHQWALSAVPFEFPTLRNSVSMSAAKYIYGCSVSDSSFGAALGRAVKIDSLVKINVECLIQRGIHNPPQQIKGCVDTRTVAQVLASQDPTDPIQVFKMPPGWYAQEPRFVPRANGSSEDDGYLVSYVFDESQLGPDGECVEDAKSELWIVDAKGMKDVLVRVHLPQRVPYGLHGNWFDEGEIQDQRPVETVRRVPVFANRQEGGGGGGSVGWTMRMWMGTRRVLERWVA